MKSTKNAFILILLGVVFCCIHPILGQTKFDLENDFNARYQVRFWNAQNYNFSSSVLSLIQSQIGHIWIGTYEGLYKFDGLDFKRIDTDKNYKHLFPSSTFWSILEDHNQNIWFASNGGGIVVYDSKEKKFKKFHDEIVHNEIILSLFEDSQGVIWAGTRKHLFKIQNQQIELVKLEQFPTLVIRSFCEDKSGLIWLATEDDGLIAMKNGKIIHHYKAEIGLTDKQVYSLFIDKKNTFWVGTTKGLFTFENEKLSPYPLHSIKKNAFPVIIRFYQDKKQNDFWVGTEEGLVHINHEKQSFITDLSENRITTITKDNEGNLWVGTYQKGLVRLKESMFLAYDKATGLVNEVVNCVIENDEKEILIATNEGLSIWKDNVFRNFTKKNGLAGNRVRDFSIGEDKIWIATYGGLSYYQNGKIATFEGNTQLQNNRLRAVFYDPKTKNLWIGSSQGLHCYTAGKKMLFYGDKELGNADIMDIIPTSEGLAISTNGGGIVFYKDNKFKKITTKEGLSGNVIFDVFQDEQKNFWIATNGGVTLLRNGKTTIFRETDGFHNNVVFQTLDDKRGKLWFTSTKSIFYFDKQDLLDYADGKKDKLYPHIFTTNDGLPSNITGAAKGSKTKDGWLVLPCLKGLALINLNTIEIKQREHKIYIEEINLDGNVLENIEDNYSLDILPEARHIRIVYTTLSYSDPQKIIFKYRLHPFEEDWIETKSREISYTSLPIGKYIFQLMASDGNGIWNKKEVAVKLQQKGYFYNHVLFYPILIAFLTLLGVVIHRYRNLHYKKAKIKLEKIVAERTFNIQSLATKIQDSYTQVSDSIRYAKHIQDAILQNDELFKSTFESFFMLWRAKDVVSGDFYWSAKERDRIIIVVGDCTGHGVPGAFMTILGTSTLDKIVHKDKIISPSEILQKLDSEIANAFHMENNTFNKDYLGDGMDISICVFDYNKNKFSFAGAKSHALYFHNDEMIELNGDRTSIGGYRKKAVSFSTQCFVFEKGDRLYLYSDGFADQFGGEKGTKYLIKRFKKFVHGIQSQNIKEQKIALEKELDEWKGNMPQIDDIICIGIEL